MKNEKDNDEKKQNSFDSFDDFLRFIIEKASSEVSEDQPVIYGFSIVQNDANKFSFFGVSISSTEEDSGKKNLLVGGLRPLVDVTKTDEEVYVTIDTRQEETNVSFQSESDAVTVEINMPEEIYSERIILPALVDPATAISSCTNGVLDIRYTRLTEV